MTDPTESALPPAPQDSGKEAHEALQKQIWERAIEKFRIAQREDPSKIEYFIGLGHAYEGKSRDQDGKPFLRLAMEEYRKALRIDAAFQPAHDALLAATTKAGLLDDLFEEYKYKLSKDPQNQQFKNSIKKIEMLLFLKADSAALADTGRGKNWVLLERVLMIAGFVCLAASVVFLTVFRGTAWSVKVGWSMIKIGGFLIVMYLGFKILHRK